jgi:hypothetical protein
MGRPFLLSTLAFLALFVLVLVARVRLENTRAALDDVYLSLED